MLLLFLFPLLLLHPSATPKREKIGVQCVATCLSVMNEQLRVAVFEITVDGSSFLIMATS